MCLARSILCISRIAFPMGVVGFHSICPRLHHKPDLPRSNHNRGSNMSNVVKLWREAQTYEDPLIEFWFERKRTKNQV